MLGLLIDPAAIVLGSLAGTLFKKGISEKTSEDFTTAFGICAMGMGISSIVLVQEMPAVVLAIVLGLLLGKTMRIEQRIGSGLEHLQYCIARGKEDPSADNLLSTAFVVLCAGSTGIYGSLVYGMSADVSILLSKSILDLFTAAVFASSAGIVIAWLSLPQMILYTALYLLSQWLMPHITPQMLADFKACGGLLLFATGLKMAKIRQIAILDLLPALLLAPILSCLF